MTFESTLTARDDIMKVETKKWSIRQLADMPPLMPLILFEKMLYYVKKKVNFLDRCGNS